MRKTFSQYIMGQIMVSNLSACAPNAAYKWQVSLAPYSGENFLDNWAAESLPFDELRTVPDGYIDLDPAFAYPFFDAYYPDGFEERIDLGKFVYDDPKFGEVGVYAAVFETENKRTQGVEDPSNGGFIMSGFTSVANFENEVQQAELFFVEANNIYQPPALYLYYQKQNFLFQFFIPYPKERQAAVLDLLNTLNTNLSLDVPYLSELTTEGLRLKVPDYQYRDLESELKALDAK